MCQMFCIQAKWKTSIDIVYSSKIVETRIIKSAANDHHAVQIMFSDCVGKTEPLRYKSQSDWSVQEIHLVLEKKF